MQTEPRTSGERRFQSDQLMLELGHRLMERGALTGTQVEDLNSRRALTGENLDRMIIREGLVDEVDVLKTLAELSGIPFRHMAELSVNAEAVRLVPARVTLRYNIMPLDLRQGVVTLATNEVPTASVDDGLRMVLNMAVEWMLCTENEISKSVKHFYGLGAETIDTIGEKQVSSEVEVKDTDVSDETADEGMIRFVNQIISEAIRMSATDIHLEPFEGRLRLRYRIDGILQEIPLPAGVASWRKAVASCVKIMADMNIAERRKPHDGRIKVKFGLDEFDLRVSLLPTAYGETVAMRILNRKSMFIDLEHLGLPEEQAPTIEYFSSLSHGVVLLTGPTGSGKTTTLYALLSRINTPDVKIITVEDPIEYQIQGINQIQTHSQIGLTFASVLRSILRHDPDIVLIGEIRDTETADIAVRASLTGHLVFSTLHTNDAPSAIMRLADMGIEPYLVSSCLEGVIAQRLVRRTCKLCAEPFQPDDVILKEIADLYPNRMASAAFIKGRGCHDCNFTGYRGRLAIFEIMELDDVIRGMIVHQRPANEIKKEAMDGGMVTLRRAGWARVLDGQTTIEEVLRVAPKSDLAVAKSGHLVP